MVDMLCYAVGPGPPAIGLSGTRSGIFILVTGVMLLLGSEPVRLRFSEAAKLGGSVFAVVLNKFPQPVCCRGHWHILNAVWL